MASLIPQFQFHIIFLFTVYFLLLLSTAASRTLTITNECDQTIWPFISNLAASTTQLSTTGFSLEINEVRNVSTPSSWNGRIWGRTHCTTDSATGNFSCLTGDCGSGKMAECSRGGSIPPTTLVEFSFDAINAGQDFYYVSLVDGFNLPVLVSPHGGSGHNCSQTGCVVDLNGDCPADLKVTTPVGETVGCKSACVASQQPLYCCIDGPATCQPSTYSLAVKKSCSRVFTSPYDDATNIFTCPSPDSYSITFCPAPDTSQKAPQKQSSNSTRGGNDGKDSASAPSINGTIADEGGVSFTARRTKFKNCVSIILLVWLLTEQLL
ncbi:PR5-like receptor kinase [Linum grandiflorum]